MHTSNAHLGSQLYWRKPFKWYEKIWNFITFGKYEKKKWVKVGSAKEINYGERD